MRKQPMPLAAQNRSAAKQRVGIRQAQTRNFCQRVGSLHFADGRGGRRDELDRLIAKQAAQAEANHARPQFIAVIDHCSTVAIDTHAR